MLEGGNRDLGNKTWTWGIATYIKIIIAISIS